MSTQKLVVLKFTQNWLVLACLLMPIILLLLMKMPMVLRAHWKRRLKMPEFRRIRWITSMLMVPLLI